MDVPRHTISILQLVDISKLELEFADYATLCQM